MYSIDSFTPNPSTNTFPTLLKGALLCELNATVDEKAAENNAKTSTAVTPNATPITHRDINTINTQNKSNLISLFTHQKDIYIYILKSMDLNKLLALRGTCSWFYFQIELLFQTLNCFKNRSYIYIEFPKKMPDKILHLIFFKNIKNYINEFKFDIEFRIKLENHYHLLTGDEQRPITQPPSRSSNEAEEAAYSDDEPKQDIVFDDEWQLDYESFSDHTIKLDPAINRIEWTPISEELDYGYYCGSVLDGEINAPKLTLNLFETKNSTNETLDIDKFDLSQSNYEEFTLNYYRKNGFSITPSEKLNLVKICCLQDKITHIIFNNTDITIKNVNIQVDKIDVKKDASQVASYIITTLNLPDLQFINSFSLINMHIGQCIIVENYFTVHYLTEEEVLIHNKTHTFAPMDPFISESDFTVLETGGFIWQNSFKNPNI